MNEQNPLESEIARLKAENERLQRENKILRETRRELHNELLKVYPMPAVSEEDLIEGMKTAVPWKTAVMDQLENWAKEAKERKNGS